MIRFTKQLNNSVREAVAVCQNGYWSSWTCLVFLFSEQAVYQFNTFMQTRLFFFFFFKTSRTL